MKKSGLINTFLKFFAVIIILWLGFILIAVILTGGNRDLSPNEVRWSFICSLIFGYLVILVQNLNKGRRLQALASKLLSDIGIQKMRSEALLEKANKVVDKYAKHESGTHTSLAKAHAVGVGSAKKRGRYITDARHFGSVVSQYPELKANESIMKLLNQLEQCENAVATAKLDYNNIVVEFNSLINSSSSFLIGRIAKFKELEYYDESQDDVSDEELGV